MDSNTDDHEVPPATSTDLDPAAVDRNLVDAALPTALFVDRHVGHRISLRRIMLGLSIQKLASVVGVTYQQILKYERGTNRITAGRLYDIAEALNVPIAWFFEDIQGAPPLPQESLQARLSLELTHNFAGITNEDLQEALSHLARALAQEARTQNSATPSESENPVKSAKN